MRNYVKTRWGQVHYSDIGAGDHTILLFHETPLNIWAYQRLAPKLAESFRVVSFDTPGYGESDPPPGITSIEDYCTTFSEAIEELQVERAVAMGTHTGASYALHLGAVTIPDRIEACVLAGMPYYEESVRRSKVPAVVPAFEDDGSHLIKSFKRPPREYDTDLLSRMTAAVCDHPDRAFWAYHAVFAYEPAHTLPLIKAPVLFLSSENDPLYDCDERALPLVPNGRRVEIPSEKMPLYWTQPAAVAREVSAFLSGLPGAQAR
jgi:pimeloyl-ACP methyl ester carboxylesterase